MSDKNWKSISDVPVRDLDMEAVDRFRIEHPELAKLAESRITPFPEKKIITMSNPTPHKDEPS